MFLVLAAPDPVARRLIELLVSQGEGVVSVGAPECLGDLPRGVRYFVGDAASIDFGLSGASYQELLELVDEVVLADTSYVASGDVEKNRLTRQAVEVAEFVRAGGAPRGVRFLSSLLVFGNAGGIVSEDEFSVGQGFRDEYEESLAVAEKVIRGLRQRVPVSVVRAAPIAGDEQSGEIATGAPLGHLAREVQSAAHERSYAFTDLPVRFETVGRAAQALLRVRPEFYMPVVHLVDEAELTDRRLIEWLAQAAGKRIVESPPTARPWLSWTRGSFPGSRSVAGWGLRFSRERAEELLGDLLDPDPDEILAGLFPRGAHAD